MRDSKGNIIISEIYGFDDYSESVFNRFDRALETIVKVYAVPPVKGVVTEGKLKWRGIRLANQFSNVCNTNVYWVEQRGVKIGPMIKMT